MSSIISGAYDLHVHAGPDLMPRKADDMEIAQIICKSGMAGFVAKSHYFCTAERAKIANKLYPGCRTIGSLTLNAAVGGINPSAVEMAGRAGAKIVFFPTADSKHEREYVFSTGYEAIPYWAHILNELKDQGILLPPVDFFQDGKLLPCVYDVLDAIARHKMILATSHISHEECFALVKAAKERKVDRIIITHVDFPSTFYTAEEQKELAKSGAYMEHCFTTWKTNKVEFAVAAGQIKALGAGQVVISSDVGQTKNVFPDEALRTYAERLIKEAGMPETDVRKMLVTNPEALLN
jgi:hypothetical protein